MRGRCRGVRCEGVARALCVRRTMIRMHARLHRCSPVCLRRNLSTACASRRERRQRNHDDCGPAHEGECGQSRASPVYVDLLPSPSIFADADLSDNWTRPCFLGFVARLKCLIHSRLLARGGALCIPPGGTIGFAAGLRTKLLRIRANPVCGSSACRS
jgi:hypothetical protein